METEPSAAVLSLLRRHGLHAHEPQLRALGATTPLHLLQLVLEDLDELDPPLTEGTAEEEQWRLGYIATPEQCEYSLANLRGFRV